MFLLTVHTALGLPGSSDTAISDTWSTATHTHKMLRPSFNSLAGCPFNPDLVTVQDYYYFFFIPWYFIPGVWDIKQSVWCLERLQWGLGWHCYYYYYYYYYMHQSAKHLTMQTVGSNGRCRSSCRCIVSPYCIHFPTGSRSAHGKLISALCSCVESSGERRHCISTMCPGRDMSPWEYPIVNDASWASSVEPKFHGSCFLVASS